MSAINGRGLNADGVTPALRCAAARQRFEAHMSAAIMTRDEIVVTRFRYPAVAICAKELRQVT